MTISGFIDEGKGVNDNQCEENVVGFKGYYGLNPSTLPSEDNLTESYTVGHNRQSSGINYLSMVSSAGTRKNLSNTDNNNKKTSACRSTPRRPRSSRDEYDNLTSAGPESAFLTPDQPRYVYNYDQRPRAAQMPLVGKYDNPASLVSSNEAAELSYFWGGNTGGGLQHGYGPPGGQPNSSNQSALAYASTSPSGIYYLPNQAPVLSYGNHWGSMAPAVAALPSYSAQQQQHQQSSNVIYSQQQQQQQPPPQHQQHSMYLSSAASPRIRLGSNNSNNNNSARFRDENEDNNILLRGRSSTFVKPSGGGGLQDQSYASSSSQRHNYQHTNEEGNSTAPLLTSNTIGEASSITPISSPITVEDKDGGLQIHQERPYLAQRRRRLRASAAQTDVLQEEFERTMYPSTRRREELAQQLGMQPRRVQIWFQNHRQAVRLANNHARTGKKSST